MKRDRLAFAAIAMLTLNALPVFVMMSVRTSNDVPVRLLFAWAVLLCALALLRR